MQKTLLPLSENKLVQSLLSFTETELEVSVTRLENNHRSHVEEIEKLKASLEQLKQTVVSEFADQLDEEDESKAPRTIDLSNKIKKIFFNENGVAPLQMISKEIAARTKINANHRKHKSLHGVKRPAVIQTPEYSQQMYIYSGYKSDFMTKAKTEDPADEGQHNSLVEEVQGKKIAGEINSRPTASISNQNKALALDSNKHSDHSTTFPFKTPSKGGATQAFFKEIGVKPLKQDESSFSLRFSSPKEARYIDRSEEKLAMSYLGGKPRANQPYFTGGTWGIGDSAGAGKNQRPRGGDNKKNAQKTQDTKFNYHYLFSKK
jgi:hypothetical protein